MFHGPAAWVNSNPLPRVPVSHNLASRCKLAKTLHMGAHPYRNSHKNKGNGSVVGRPGRSILFGGCCYLFPPCYRTHPTTPSV